MSLVSVMSMTAAGPCRHVTKLAVLAPHVAGFVHCLAVCARAHARVRVFFLCVSVSFSFGCSVCLPRRFLFFFSPLLCRVCFVLCAAGCPLACFASLAPRSRTRSPRTLIHDTIGSPRHVGDEERGKRDAHRRDHGESSQSPPNGLAAAPPPPQRERRRRDEGTKRRERRLERHERESSQTEKGVR